MNVVFLIGITLSIALLGIFNPEQVLNSVSSGAYSAVTLSFKMTAIYVFWLGVLKIAEKLELPQKLSKIISPVTKFLLGEIPKDAADLINMNFAANVMGIGNAATPLGIEAVKKLNDTDVATYATVMFFVINATSLQIIPTTVLSLRAAANSLTPYDVVLPCFIVSLLTTVIGVILVKLTVKK